MSSFECLKCKKSIAASRILFNCDNCGGEISIRYDLEKAARSLRLKFPDKLIRSLYRYAALLPVKDPAKAVSMGEGGTPLLALKSLGRSIGTPSLFGKDETRNPTHSFKDRPISVAVSVLKEIGVSDAGCVSGGGNTASSVAAYCARGGIRAHLYMPSSTPKVKILHALALGAEVNLIEGTNSYNAFRFGISEIRKKHYTPLMTRPQFNPYTVEGCKTIAFELAEQTEWHPPDWIVVGVGTGTNLAGLWKGFEELYECKLIQSLPRLAGVQAETCMPLVDAFKRDLPAEKIMPWPDAHTIASGLNDAYPDACIGALKALRDSRGTAVSVSDQEIMEAELLLARKEGIFAEPAAAASIAGLVNLVKRGLVTSSHSVVCVITGSGVKQPDALAGFVDLPSTMAWQGD